MGIQHYLGLVLGSVAVGTAIAVGINSTDIMTYSYNENVVLTESVYYAALAQAWYLKPDVLGGGNQSFRSLSFYKLGLSSEPNSMEITTENGTYSIYYVKDDCFELHCQTVEVDQDGEYARYQYMVYPHRLTAPQRLN